MQFIRRWSPIVLALALSACASRETVDNVQRDMDEMKTRMFKMEKDIGGMRSEAKEGIDKTIKDVQNEMDNLRKGSADLQATLDSAKVDMQVLTGKVDDVRLLAQKPADDLALLKEDTDRRLTAMEERLLKLDKSFEELHKTLAEAKNKEMEQAPDALYQRGLDTLKGGDPQKAREYFTKFIELFPKHELTANARYWLGETYYHEKKYDQAILEFQEVIKNYPGKEKVPAAMLKQAMAFKELGDAKSARYVYKKLIEDSPYTDEARIAKEKLKELK
ncbi:tol-pal system protein YbgF [Geotalea uraniireducens]|uniref:Tetratricopeptide TPR_2 repeat protein n=1 Tax=Geotalea uraniireducens (strain Rf4) TaxID=351605 RepID=A5GDD8_GEOUR|nr:tol-pal system protein YbgF [Geotalea uraniireducens]ABQ24417.1 Tetratricopeptide TPR_2 repeat protein [Geotalea uraniireducens Rf4]